MKDRKGNELAIGDRVFVFPDYFTLTGGTGIVRAFSKKIGPIKARVDDGTPEDIDISTSKSYTWSAWVKSSDIEKL